MHWLTVLIFFAATVGYLFIGAAVFNKLESSNEQETKAVSRLTLSNFLGNASCIDEEQLEKLIRFVLHSYDQGVPAYNDTNDNWDLWSSFFFSATVVTTIGYGHISPSTQNGKLFCIFYAIVGIPVVGIFLMSLGQKIFIPFKIFKNRSKNKFVKIAKSLAIAIFGFAVLIFLPAVGFHRYEEWSIFDAIYYSVITITTVGFGDFVVGQEKTSYRGGYQVLTILWIFVGLAWTAVVLSDIRDYTTAKIEHKQENRRTERRKTNEFDAVRTQSNKTRRFQEQDEYSNKAFSVI